MRCALQATALLALLLAPGIARAGDATPSADDSGWEISFAPYLWGISMAGDASIDDVSVDIDVPFKDIVDKLNFGLMGRVEARKGRWFGVFDGLGAVLEDELSAGPVTASFGPGTATAGTSIGPRGRGSAGVGVSVPQVSALVGPVDVEVDTRLLLFGLYGGYRVLATPMGALFGEAASDDPRRLNLDLFAGARYWNVKMEADVFVPPVSVPGFTVSTAVRVTGPRPGQSRMNFGEVQVPGVTVGGLDEDFETTLDWVDAVIGARVSADLTQRLQLIATGDVGGFGIGSAADVTWQALGVVGWRIGESWSLQLGYRAIGVDLDRGVNSLDLVAHGPILGAVWRWRP
ncbi:MAG: hypothetical protein JRG85_16150 [Deltaproteobacteria bacterium]|nr:hypothetical protein [Deltaproteobacteria bacterium]